MKRLQVYNTSTLAQASLKKLNKNRKGESCLKFKCTVRDSSHGSSEDGWWFGGSVSMSAHIFFRHGIHCSPVFFTSRAILSKESKMWMMIYIKTAMTSAKTYIEVFSFPAAACSIRPKKSKQVQHHCCFHGKERSPVLAYRAIQQQDDYDHRCHECCGVAVEECLVPWWISIMEDWVADEMPVPVIRPKSSWWEQPSLVCDAHCEGSNQNQIFSPFMLRFSSDHDASLAIIGWM